MKSSLICFFTFLTFTASAQPLTINLKDAGRATLWDDAYAQCENLGEGWHLLNLEEYAILVMTGQIPKVQVPGTTGYPAWVQGNSAEENEKLKGTTYVVYLSDGNGMTLGQMDVSEFTLSLSKAVLPQIEAQLEKETDPKALAGLKEVITNIKSVINAIDGGFTVRCAKYE